MTRPVIIICLLTIARLQSQDLESCYRGVNLNVNKKAVKLEDVLESDRKPRKNKTVFFHVTNCLKDGLIKLTARQSCAIESAALSNPKLDVFVLFTSPTYYMGNISLPILSYSNVFLRNNDPWKYIKTTIAEKWFKSGEIFKSEFAISHISDLLTEIPDFVAVGWNLHGPRCDRGQVFRRITSKFCRGGV